MKKELIWNISLMFFGICLVFAFTVNINPNLAYSPFHQDSLLPPVGIENKIKFGLIVGLLFILFRYINLAILSIANKDLRLLVLLLSYSSPVLLVFFGWHLYLNSEFGNWDDDWFPIEAIEKEINDVRKTGMFKSYPDKSNAFITELALGRAITKGNGWAYSGTYWNNETNSINTLELLRLDTEKVLQMEDTEIIIKGNREYESIIKELGKISEGHFKPTAIKEDWVSRELINLTFDIGEKEHTIQPLVRSDWADISGILEYVNGEILDTVDYQFYYGQGGDIFVIGLTTKERVDLTEMTGIEFREIKINRPPPNE